ncbi:unnamed protein product [Cuscuta europaea]|uniref:DUF4371 domain-containing protein n=1 Tax=Cuscuta europaea TaxID=41803 RepID=A0A9P1E753_CUSEU|nr:unnamed protein product [Cuscuta europaea]
MSINGWNTVLLKMLHFVCHVICLRMSGKLGVIILWELGFQHGIKKRFYLHVGKPNSPHYNAVKRLEDLMNQKQSIGACFVKQSEQAKSDYLIRLKASLECTRFLLCGGLPFRGHDESIKSSYKGHFLETLDLLRQHDSEIDRVLKNAPQNNQMTSPKIQKDLCYACAFLTVHEIIKQMRDDVFAILVDESGDVSGKEQMAIVVRFIASNGSVLERFIGLVHVKDTVASPLKESLENILTQYGLCISNIRGQGYDGASNMRGKFGGLKTLIQNENPYAYYVHCLAHQLQLSLVAAVKGQHEVNWLLLHVSRVINEICSSNKRQKCLRDKQASDLISALEVGLVKTGRGLNQQLALVRAGDTRWSSHYKSLLNLQKLFKSVVEVLEDLEDHDKSGEATSLLNELQTFEFCFMLHLMINVLAITHDLSQALQRREQDLVNALKLVTFVKQRLAAMKTDIGWGALFDEVVTFCNKFHIDVPSMDQNYIKGKKIEAQGTEYNEHASLQV